MVIKYNGIEQIANGVLGYNATYDLIKSANAKFKVSYIDRVQVETNLKRKVDVLLNPFYNNYQQVTNYPYDNRSDIFIVGKALYKNRIETFSWNTYTYYASRRRSEFLEALKDNNHKNAIEKDNYRNTQLHSAIVKLIPDIDQYLQFEPNNAREQLLKLGWNIPPQINFTYFCPGSWLDRMKTPYCPSTRAGVNNVMNFTTRSIDQYCWSSDG